MTLELDCESLFNRLLASQLEYQATLPPVDKWQPPLCGDLDMRIDRNGDWYYCGGRISRQRMVNLFASILKREGDDYFLLTPVEKWRISVDEVPFVITSVELQTHLHDTRAHDTEACVEQKKQAIVFTTNTGADVVLGPDNPLWVEENPASGEPRPYLHVRQGLNARIGRSVFYHLVDMAVSEEIDGKTWLGVWSLANFYPLGES